MARYTTNLEVVVNNLCENRNNALNIRVESARKKIFDFSYPTPQKIEDFKRYFETLFIFHYLTDEFAFETYNLWKVKLQSKSMEVMPGYAKAFDGFAQMTADLAVANQKFNRKTDSNATGKSKSTGSFSNQNDSNSTMRGAASDLPGNMMKAKDFNSIEYADRANLDTASNKATDKGSNTNTNDITTKTNQLETITGLTMPAGEVFRQFKNEVNGLYSELLDEYKTYSCHYGTKEVNMNYPKPDVDPISVLRRFYCNRILPQVYDDSLSFEELLYGVLKKMNEVIEKVNSYDELINYVIDLLENLDKHIKETVTEQLQKWYDDGTLKEILAVICAPYFDEFRKEIAQLKKDFVTFKNQPHSTYVDFERWLLGWTYRGENLANAEKETNRYPVNQGGARYTIGGNNYYACAFVPRGHTLELHPTTAAVVVFNYSNGAQVARRDIEGLGHANSIVYNSKRNSLFVATSELNGTPSKTIFELNPTTLATIQKYSAPAGYNESAVSSVAYDQTNDQMYISQGLNVYEWDPATNTASNMVSLSNPGFDYTMQTIKANATAFVMLTYSPNTIRVYDKSGVYLRQFTIPQYLDNQRFWSGEFEDLTVNDKFYVYANSQGITAVNPTDSMISIWRGSLLQGTPSSIKQTTTQGQGVGYSTFNNIVYVNNAVGTDGTYH